MALPLFLTEFCGDKRKFQIPEETSSFKSKSRSEILTIRERSQFNLAKTLFIGETENIWQVYLRYVSS